MWKAKIEIEHDCIFTARSELHDTKISVITTNSYEEDGKQYSQHFGVVLGDNVDACMEDFRDDDRVVSLEREDNAFLLVEERAERETPGSFYSPELIYVRPPYTTEHGSEVWEVAAFKKATISEFIEHSRSVVESLEIQQITETTGEDVYFATMAPNLTDTQRTNLLCALQNGYFEHPRETSLQELAKGAGVSRAAYTESLRAAEKKLLESFFHPSYEG